MDYKKIMILFNEKIVSYLEKLSRWIYINTKSNYELNSYSGLTPKDNIKKESNYIKSLKWAIDNENIRNIAISGPYGSGKSSIIESFKRHHREHRYINISLATFIEDNNTDIDDKLEKRIVEQLFYKVSYEKIPFSRYRKIRNIKNRDAMKIITILVGCIGSIALIINPDLIKNGKSNLNKLTENISGITYIGQIPNIIKWIVIGAGIIFSYVIIVKLIKIVNSKFMISKIVGKGVNIEATREPGETIFNKYIDEIMYFFEATKYDVIFFEDIDRFNDLNIFTKLRELNILINNSKQIKQNVKFVYAIKDDIFGELTKNERLSEEVKTEVNKENKTVMNNKKISENRTKFFDFIIPVIPTVNNENSHDKLLEMFGKLDSDMKIDENLISDVSMYIEDMRLITNIFNEYVVIYKAIAENYKEEKSKNPNLCIEENSNKDTDYKGNPNKLFAMVVYKNLYPVDFSMVQHQENILTSIFKAKGVLIENLHKEKEKEIKDYNKDLIYLENEHLYKEEELFNVYKINWESRGIVYIKIGDTARYINDLKIIEVVRELLNYESVEAYGGSYSNYKIGDFKIDELFDMNGNGNYLNRFIVLNKIGQNNKTNVNELKNKLKSLEAELLIIEGEKIANILRSRVERGLLESLVKELRDKPFIMRMLIEGYIDESYKNIISYFYTGNLDIEEYEFVQAVLNRVKLPIDYKISKYKEILKKLRVNDFKDEYILNLGLISFIIDNKKYEEYKQVFIEQILIMEDMYIKFIDKFIDTENEDKIVELILAAFKKSNSFWRTLNNSIVLTQEKKDKLLVIMINKISIDYLLSQNTQNEISNELLNREYLFNFLENGVSLGKFEELILNIDIKFSKLSVNFHRDNIEEKNRLYTKYTDIIYRNNSYEINEDILGFILRYKVNGGETLNDLVSYTKIKELNLDKMLVYINEKINSYVDNIYIPKDIKESVEVILELINNKDIRRESIISIIKTKEFVVENINTIDNYENWVELFKNRKIQVSWRNIIEYYNRVNEFDEMLIDYINDTNSQKVLSKHLLRDQYEEYSENSIVNFISRLIINDNIKEITIERLVGSLVKFSLISFSNVSIERAKLLISSEIVSFSENMFSEIKRCYPELIVDYIEVNIKDYINESESYTLERIEFLTILNSEKLDYEDKIRLIDIIKEKVGIDEDIIEHFYNIISNCMNEKSIDSHLIANIIESGIDKAKKIKLLSNQVQYLSNDESKVLVKSIDSEYAELIDKNKGSCNINREKYTKELLSALKNKDIIGSFNDIKGKKIQVYVKKG